MAKKIKKPKTKEEKAAEREAKALEAEKAAEGVNDEFQALGREVVEKASESRGLILGALGLVVVIGIGLGVSTFMTSASNGEASTIYGQALEAFDAPVGEKLPGEADSKVRFADEKERSQKARELFRSLVSQHGGSDSSNLAQLYIGHTSAALGEFDAALEAYRAFKSAISPSDPLYFAGLDGEAHALESKGDLDGAISVLAARVGKTESVARDVALMNLARLYSAKGDKEKSKSTLETLKKDYPEAMKSDVEALLGQLG